MRRAAKTAGSAAGSPAPEPEKLDAGAATYSVSLPMFEGPLDLLLHLCQKHELDILDIPISFITQKYLEYLDVLQLMHLDVASEYLVMAATLAHIKSKMLLPAPPPGQEDDIDVEEEDPREALIRRLLEYQKYKQAAAELGARGVAGRDVFQRGIAIEEAVATGLAPLAEVPLFSLLDAFQAVLARTKVKLTHDIVADRISITDRIHEIAAALQGKHRIVFDDLFTARPGEGPISRFELVITFLALLEMTRLRMTRIFQTDPLSPIYIEVAVGRARREDRGDDSRPSLDDDSAHAQIDASDFAPPIAAAPEPAPPIATAEPEPEPEAEVAPPIAELEPEPARAPEETVEDREDEGGAAAVETDGSHVS